MKRILVIGCPGSGKSTFARSLQKLTALPLYPLDLLLWNADRTTVEHSVFLERLSRVLAQDAWIIDGNYFSTMPMRLQASDTVFFLDLPEAECLQGIQARQGTARPDLPWIEPADEPIDPEFLELIHGFEKQQRPQILQLLDRCREKQEIHVFRSHEAADAWLDRLAIENDLKQQ